MKSVLRIGLLLLPTFCVTAANRVDGGSGFRFLPKLTLWAWQMPERLSFIDPAQIAVAYLDQTIHVRDRVTAEPRLQPLVVAPGTRVIAVVRLEMPAPARTATEEIKNAVVSAVLRSAWKPGIAALQVDFDAARSQREFYREVLIRVRAGMPKALPLSITALASWCAFDNWIAGLPVDEAVPMMFRMGVEGRGFERRHMEDAIREPLCQGSLGVSTDEPWPDAIAGRRLYVFGVQPWTPEWVERIVAKAEF